MAEASRNPPSVPHPAATIVAAKVNRMRFFKVGIV
jgi:hypothetical protein